MLNIGIIGNTEVLEPHVKRIQKNKNVRITGKASVGSSAQINSFHYSIPEINRVELIERADVLLLDNSSSIPFKLLFDIVKRSKHIFTVEYLKLTSDECAQLVKLTNESQSIIQVLNPFFYTPAIQWLNSNFISPQFLDISKFSEGQTMRDTLFPLLLMLSSTTGLHPKKVKISVFPSEKEAIDFANVRLEFSNTSVANINFGNKLPEGQFSIKGFSKNQVFSFNFKKEDFQLNGKSISFSDKYHVNEFDIFIDSIENKNQNSSNIEEYLSATQLIEIVEKKLTQLID